MTEVEVKIERPEKYDVDLNIGEEETINDSEERQGRTYLEQMDDTIDTVLSEESHLIEFKVVSQYRLLTDASKLFHIRLFMRQHSWLSVNKLDKRFYENKEDSVKELSIAGFIQIGDDSITVEEKLKIMTKEDLKELSEMYSFKSNGRKGQIIENLIRSATEVSITGQDLIQLLRDRVDSVLGCIIKQDPSIRLFFQELFVISERLERWPENDAFMTTSIRTNLSDQRLNYVKTNVCRTGLIWPILNDFQEYVAALRLELELQIIISENCSEAWTEIITHHSKVISRWREDIKSCSPDGHLTGIGWFAIFTATNVNTRILQIIYQAFFRLKMHQEGQALLGELCDQRIFLSRNRGYWYDERSKILERYVNKNEARKLCLEALSDNFVMTGHRSSLIKRLDRISKGKPRWHIEDSYATTVSSITGTRVRSEHMKVTMLGKGGANLSVEQFALEHYKELGWFGFHSENSILTTLFGLLFWDILFMDVPGVFTSPYQSYPLDLKTVYFYDSRRESILKRLLEIESGLGPSIISNRCSLERANMTVCIGVSWQRFTTEEVVQIAECIGASGLSKVCGLFGKSYWAHRGGVPDLCLWNPELKLFKLVEVKSDNDKLSAKQVVWLSHLKSFGIEAETLNIRTIATVDGIEQTIPGMLKKRKLPVDHDDPIY